CDSGGADRLEEQRVLVAAVNEPAITDPGGALRLDLEVVAVAVTQEPQRKPARLADLVVGERVVCTRRAPEHEVGLHSHDLGRARLARSTSSTRSRPDPAARASWRYVCSKPSRRSGSVIGRPNTVSPSVACCCPLHTPWSSDSST